MNLSAITNFARQSPPEPLASATSLSPIIHAMCRIVFGITMGVAAAAHAQKTEPNGTWEVTGYRSFEANFVRMQKEAVVLRKEGREVVIPLTQLAPASLKQARQFATATEPADVAQIRQCLDRYVREGKFGGFYDYAQPGRAIRYETLDPAILEVPAEAWPRARENGLPAFLEAVRRIHASLERPDSSAPERPAAFAALLRLFDDFPFLRVQAYNDEDPAERGSAALVPNNVFVQYLSRCLLLLTEGAQPKLNQKEERRAIANALFPKTKNGQMGATVFEKHGVLLAGFGVRADVESKAHREPLLVRHWKSTNGPPHTGGLFDYGYFTTDYLEEVGKFFDLLPPHLIGGGGQFKPMTTMTCHGYYYIYEMEDFAQKYFPQESDARAWLGYLHGQALNVFGPASTDFKAGVATQKFRTKSLAEAPSKEVPAHLNLIVLAHETVHYLHTTVAQRRPDYAKRLEQILALGVREKTNIRAIDVDIQNFAGSGLPAWEWFVKVPQESIATVANVFYIDPVAVLQWCAAVASKENVLAPLNHALWVVDVHSLDAGYRETGKTFLLTLQPSGRKFRRIECAVTRDAQDRLVSLVLPSGKMVFSYDGEGTARMAN